MLTIRFFTVSISFGLLAAANRVRLASASLLIIVSPEFEASRLLLFRNNKKHAKYWSQNMGSDLFSEEVAESERFRLLLSANTKMPISDFIKLLETEMENQKNNPDSEIDLIGVKVAAKTIVRLAPFIVIAIMIYLLMLINHLNDTATLKQHTDEIADFPWMGVFRGPVTSIGFSISTIVIPLLGAFSPHLASRGTKGLGTFRFGASLIVFLIFALAIQASVGRLHEKVKVKSNIKI